MDMHRKIKKRRFMWFSGGIRDLSADQQPLSFVDVIGCPYLKEERINNKIRFWYSKVENCGSFRSKKQKV